MDVVNNRKNDISISFMSELAEEYNMVIDRDVCCPQHGKSIVDDINDITKNTVITLTFKKVSSIDVATMEDSKNIKIYMAIEREETKKF